MNKTAKIETPELILQLVPALSDRAIEINRRYVRMDAHQHGSAIALTLENGQVFQIEIREIAQRG